MIWYWKVLWSGYIITLVNIQSPHIIRNFFSWDENIQDLLSNFQIYSMVVLAVVTMLYITWVKWVEV